MNCQPRNPVMFSSCYPRRLAGVVSAGAALLFLSACGNSHADDGQRPGGNGTGDRAIPVAAQIAVPADLNVTLRGSANLRPRERVEVVPKQAGVVARLHVEEGDIVRQGQPLASLDAEEWRLQARQAEARASSATDAATRARSLREQGLISDEEAERLTSEAQVAQADAELARLRVRNATITSPLSGVVTHRNVERGSQVGTTNPAFVVADISRLEAVVGIPEREAGRVEVGQTARVRVQETGAGVAGRVARIRPVVDPESGTVQVTVEVDPGQATGLSAGQFVNVDIVTETLGDRIAVPRTAVLVDGASPRIYVVENGRAQEREVEMGVSQGDRVELRSGVSPGDTVVVVGQDNLRPNAAVRLMEVDGTRIDRPAAPAAAEQAAEGERPSREEIERRLRERGMSARQAREMAERIERGEMPQGRPGGSRPGGGRP